MILALILPVLGILVYHAVSNFYTNVHNKVPQEELKICQYHDWCLDYEDNLVCGLCNKKAGN